MPSVSIIMPVYNAERYLDVSVGSVLAQTSPDWELVCFNDASTDTSAAILQKYAGADSRITVIDSPVNVKQGGGRNRAIRAAKGEYILFLDADDRLNKDAVKLCLNAARRYNADTVLFDYERFGADGAVLGAEPQLGEDAPALRRFELKKRIVRRPAPLWCGMYRRSLITENALYFPENAFYEDNAVALAIQLSASEPVKIDGALYGYRCDNVSVTRSTDNYRFFHRLASARILKGHLQRLGLYEPWRDEIDFLLLNQYYVHTVFGCVYRFGRVPMLRLRYVCATVERVIPGYKSNPYYRAMPPRQKIKLAAHVRFPRAIKCLSRIKNSLRP